MGHIFISYSHKDTEYAHSLAAHLQNKGLETWIDERLDYGSQWPHELQKQLDTCSAFILIMTPRSYASEWVQSELQRARRKLKPVFPLLLEGDEPWLSVESTQFYDVRGEKFPDAKFFAALERVLTPKEVSAAASPMDPKQHVARSSEPKPPRVKTGVVIGIFGAVATLLVAMIPILSSMFSRQPEAPPAGAPTATLAEVSPTESGAPTEASTVAVSTEPGVTEDVIDSMGIPMRFVAAGNFIMGNNESQYPEEKPVHTVYLDNFYIDKYEVTNALYSACVSAGVCEPPSQTGSSTRDSYYGDSQFEDYPVVFVDWEDADAYCRWRGMKLPTEAQWEKAARGIDARTFPWGAAIDESYANYNDSVGDTTAVGSYEKGKSPYGVYDMAGNAWEWVADWFSSSYYLETPLTNPLGPPAGQYRVLRGGSWHNQSETVTTSSRGWNQLEYFENVDFGFRCASDETP